MPSIIGWVILFIVSLAILVKASDFFIKAAEIIGLYIGLPSFVVGVVIIGVGTSLPELVSSIASVINNASAIVVGNVLGSNITNIFLVLGIAGIVGKSFHIKHNIFKYDIPFLFGSAILLSVMLIDGNYSIGEGILSIATLILYIFYTVQKDDSIKEEKDEKKIKPKLVNWIFLIISPVFIWLGAFWTVKSVSEIALILNIGEEIIALSAIALGTSLPEVIVTISAAKKGKPEMAVGNIIGSNIFNTLAVMGIPSFIGPLTIPKSITSFSIPVFLSASLLYVLIVMDKKVNRGEGFLLLAFYIFFIGKLFNLL